MQISRTRVSQKKSHVCSAINSFQLHCRPDSLKAVNLDFSPENEKKQNKIKQKMLNIWIKNFKVLFLRNSRELGFLCDCIIGVCSLNVLKNLFIMLLS